MSADRLDDLTHAITVVVSGRYPHGREQPQASVTVNGDGGIGHALDAFRAALVAMGFSAAVAGRLTVEEAA